MKLINKNGKKKYRVCVYAICKNEACFVDRWMDSMNEADLIVVTDTGSTDDTVSRLRSRGAKVYNAVINPWRFDTARNISLEHVPGNVDICVCTDLDEVFVPGWREKLEASWQPETNTGRYIYNWSLKPDGSPDVQLTYFKVHSRKGYRWAYPVHECLKYDGKTPENTVFIDGMILNHYPDNKKSRGSYLPLLESAVEEKPEDDRVTYYLGREYMYHGDWQKCIATLKIHLNLKTAVWCEERCASMRWIARSYYMLGNVREASSWYYKAIAEAPYMRDAYVECAKMAYELSDWPLCFYMAQEALRIKTKSQTYTNMGYAWDYTPNDLAAISSYWLGMYDKSLDYAKAALTSAPDDQRLIKNLHIIERKVYGTDKKIKDEDLFHTLLFLVRKDNEAEDMRLAASCLKSLEKSKYKTVVVYNQGYLANEKLKEFLDNFKLNFILIGSGVNAGIPLARQSCFELIWNNYPNVKFISEIHLDMIFTGNWEIPLIDYLIKNDEPVISCGIIDKEGNIPFLDAKVKPDEIMKFKNIIDEPESLDNFLKNLRLDKIVHGFTNPCIHVSKIIQKAGGYNPDFLKGKQCFEDDSLLLGYYYYYGVRADWKPKVNYNSVVYHAVAGQRLSIGDSIMPNFNGLVQQYGAMGLKHLSQLHKSEWQRNFFETKYNEIIHEIKV